MPGKLTAARSDAFGLRFRFAWAGAGAGAAAEAAGALPGGGRSVLRFLSLKLNFLPQYTPSLVISTPYRPVLLLNAEMILPSSPCTLCRPRNQTCSPSARRFDTVRKAPQNFEVWVLDGPGTELRPAILRSEQQRAKRRDDS